MPLPASGQIAFSQLAAELVNACTNIGLRAYSACANCTSPDGITELYGKTCTPVYGAGVWTAGGSMVGAVLKMGGAGTQNAALGVLDGNAEIYNGATWAVGGNLSVVRDRKGTAGETTSAGLTYGGLIDGEVTNITEAYNGASWSSGGLLITCVYNGWGAGSQNAALTGNAQGDNQPWCVFAYNGSGWSTRSRTISDYCINAAGVGTQNAALSIGGQSQINGCSTNRTEEYNGSSWATGGNLIVARAYLGGTGTQNAALVTGGSYLTNTEAYNGLTWSAGTPLPQGKYGLAAAGTLTQALAFGGYGYNTTHAYNIPIIGKCLG